MNWFITGTDTGAGKTYVSSLLIRSFRRAGLDTVGMKPIACGDRDDAGMLHAACGGAVPLDLINPFWLRTPAAPYTASMIEERPIDLELIMEKYRRLRSSHRSIIVEGAGGWLVPIRRDYFMSDLAREMELPVVVVVRNRLGAINHTLLTIQAIKATGLPLQGLIINNMDDADDPAGITNGSILEDIAGAPILFEIAKDQRDLEVGIA